ncbi:hypothetical protein AB0M28_00510 [Streptomyces sp. NPDC051940]|uniref:hypothetical protein n=1 Tax=Streptomyces sp. NPDC051940 TaxID=3155675 RepID=UPI0034385AC0
MTRIGTGRAPAEGFGRLIGVPQDTLTAPTRPAARARPSAARPSAGGGPAHGGPPTRRGAGRPAGPADAERERLRRIGTGRAIARNPNRGKVLGRLLDVLQGPAA